MKRRYVAILLNYAKSMVSAKILRIQYGQLFPQVAIT